LYDDLYSSWQKRGWHYTWLLYKSGEFKRAYANLTRLAERSSGQRRARHLYWAARTLERGGNVEKAAELYREVSSAYDLNYYGIQANNRLIDIEQRRALDDTLLSQAPGVVDGGQEVLTALDSATDELSGDRSVDMALHRDPRTVPRSPDLEDESSTPSPAKRCAGPQPDDAQACPPSTSRLDDSSWRLLEESLGPIQPYRSVLWGTVSYVGTSDGEESVRGGAELARQGVESDRAASRSDAPSPPRRAAVADIDQRVQRAPYHTDARIYWEGRGESPVAFVKAEQGEVIGPLPDEPTAYDSREHRGGLERVVDEVGHLFPQLERALWLRDAGYHKYARWAMRDAAIEYGGLATKSRPRSSPHELSEGRWDYLIDNRRSSTGLWGIDSDEKRYPVPSSSDERRALLERQQEIYERRDELEELMLDAMKDVGDYHLVRRATLGTGPWYRREPDGPVRDKWMQAYPRAFPRQVLSHSLEQGINPYLLWALMTVESSYNPDSISPANALGLLQVIPRTGIKTAQMLGDEDFGPYDLVNEDVAIEHGAFYFRNLVEKFHGQELLAIAGYNGGPHRVAAWLDKRGRNMPMDEFVEEIPFDEARGYVKKVVRFLNLYLRIYEGVDNLYIGQNMRVDYRPDPNF
ncbi:MAG: transglycosylase SLT domain-containing protein, partial [Persicimonas sp.]